MMIRMIVGGVVGAWLTAAPALAAEWGASVEGGLAYSDNVERVPDGNSVTVATAGFAGQFIDMRRTYDVDMEAFLAYREYFDSDYESDTLPQFRGEANWAPWPERFAWTLRDNFGQVGLTPAESLQPSDRQNVNVLSTGPAVTVPIGRRWNLQLAGLYSDVYYEDDDFDNNRTLGTLTIEREISRNQSAYLTGFASRTEFKESVYGGYDISGVAFGYDGLGTRTGITAEFGVEELHDAGEVDSAWYADVGIDRRLSERVEASLRYVSRFADSSDIFALDQDLEPQLGGTANVQVSGTPIDQELASVDVNWEGLRSTAGVTALWATENVDSLTLPDRDIYGLSVRGGRRLSSKARVGMAAYYLREKRSDTENTDQDDYALSLELDMALGEKVSLLMQVERFSRRNSPGNYDENRVIVSLRYAPRAVMNDLPSFFERRLNRRFVAGREEAPE